MKRIIWAVSVLVVSILWVSIASTMAFAGQDWAHDREAYNNYEKLVQKLVQQGAPEVPTRLTLEYFYANQKAFPNKRFVTVIDMSQHSGEDRFFLIDMTNQTLKSYLVAHGKGSDPAHSGYARRFSNQARSNATSVGFYKVAETYSGKHGYSVRMDGLSATNSNARARAIVIHGANYVKRGLAKMGRSLGCPALEQNLSKGVIDKIRNGSLLFVYGETSVEADLNYE